MSKGTFKGGSDEDRGAAGIRGFAATGPTGCHGPAGVWGCTGVTGFAGFPGHVGPAIDWWAMARQAIRAPQYYVDENHNMFEILGRVAAPVLAPVIVPPVPVPPPAVAPPQPPPPIVPIDLQIPPDNAPDEKPTGDEPACAICMDNRICTVNVPCGHAVFCCACIRKCKQQGDTTCPICRQEMTVVQRVYKPN